MLRATGKKDGQAIPLKGRTVSEIEQEANRQGLSYYREQFTGGATCIRLEGQWVVLR